MDMVSDANEYLGIDKRIQYCERVLREQCHYLIGQVESGNNAGDSKAMLLCLHQCLEVMQHAREKIGNKAGPVK
ncbi:hypothetical protein [Caballeronia cordobensis]|uniref:hypothetical protein n=1 Tax=Caballeronia cordobensis TaxID=1353886 RepID=UPI00128F9A19|nr:hypothetical protein [Caballeronia cordobensis]